jgi:sugar phosphate isomerase/epimerase
VILLFRRAVITDEISQDFEHAVKLAHQYGLNGVELRSVWDKNPHELTNNEVSKIQETIQQYGMQLPCLAAPIFKCKLRDDLEYQEHLRILEKTIEVAGKLKAGLIRGFTFWDEGSFETDLPLIIEKIAAVQPMLEKAGITMVIESDPTTSANSTQKLERVFNRKTFTHVKALWDPGNNLYINEAERPFPESYERLKSFIGHIHIKDIKHDPVTGQPDGCRLGTGEVGFVEVFKRLKQDGYNGWLTLETHFRLRRQLSESLLALPKGSAFSLGGEEATIQCLESWNDIIRVEEF